VCVFRTIPFAANGSTKGAFPKSKPRHLERAAGTALPDKLHRVKSAGKYWQVLACMGM